MFLSLLFFLYIFLVSFCLGDVITQFELCAVVRRVMLSALLINFLICVTLMHFSTDTSMQVELPTDKHILTGMINLLISFS